jgi:thimet oligopeptidase
VALPSDNWHDWLVDRVEGQLQRSRDVLDTLKDGTARSTTDVLELWNDADIALRNAASVSNLLSEVHPDAHVRTLAERLGRDVDRQRTERDLDPVLYDVLDASVTDGQDAPALRLHERVLRDFRRAGVDRNGETRRRVRAIAERLTKLEQDFARVIRDDVRTIRITPDQLAGLPDDFAAAHPAGEDGRVVITTDYPDYVPFRTYAHDAEARRRLTTEFLNRGWPANDPVLHEMLALREEKASILGYRTWPDYDADVKMIGSAQAIAEFIERISDAAEPAGRRELQLLVDRQRAEDPGATTFDFSQLSYYTEMLRRERFDVDAQVVRRYFEFGNVRRGLLHVTGRLFGIEYRRVDAPTWHPDVAVFDVVASDGGTLRGRIHLDLHPREGKFKHAAQFDLVIGVGERQLPEGALVCNLPRGLMEHQHVITLFHEFGHLVHHILGGRQKWARFSGVATEWDFVEAPSQMLEEWAWDADVLRSFAVDADGAPIPRELVAHMNAAKDFGKALYIRTQIYYAAISYLLHRDRPDDHTTAMREIQERYDLLDPIDGTHFQAAFGHLAGYTSGYYTYLWSLVIAKDLFSAFDPADLLAPETAHRYRDRILAPGGSKDAAELVRDFLGRDFTFDAFGAWLDRAAVPTGS